MAVEAGFAWAVLLVLGCLVWWSQGLADLGWTQLGGSSGLSWVHSHTSLAVVGWGLWGHWAMCFSSSNGLALAFSPSNCRRTKAKVETPECFFLSFGLYRVCPMFKASHKLRTKEWGNMCPLLVGRAAKSHCKGRGSREGWRVGAIVGWVYLCACWWYGQHCLFISRKDKYMCLCLFKYIFASV